MSTTDIFSKLRILLVDDEPFIHQITSGVLESIGVARVFGAENGLDAISLLGQHEIDLLISDIQMPKMNGLELIQKIRIGETPVDRGLRTIVITSFTFSEVLSSCLLLDINGFLVKPITPESAKEKIHVALKEQPNLRSIDAYRKVRTDLAVIKTASKKEQLSPHYAADRSEPVPNAIPGCLWVPISKLQPGMELHDDMYAKNGIKLLRKGQVLTQVMAHRVIDLERIINGSGIRIKSD